MAGTFLQDLTPHLTRIRIPERGEKIYKDECVFSFDNPESETGLYLCLNTFLGLGREHVQRHHCKTGNAVFLHIRREKIELYSAEHQGDGPEKKVTRLAIGVEGGFDPNADKKKFEVHETLSVVLLPQFSSMPFPSNELPSQLSLVITAVMEAESATKLAELEALSGTWDGEARIVTKHANTLTQLENGRRVPPEGWKCEQCDLTTNLWLNLTDGSILCGRKFYVVTGGNDHAIQHYKSTGYPLAVKLGTITKDGKGDVFSYDEDDMVEDPNLVQHLAHFGINIANMEKTEKSMVEWELELNQRVGEWSALQESGGCLRPKFGPGYTGLTNLGNSCYLNAVMQVMFAIPHFVTRYVDGAQAIFDQAPPDPANDFNVQTAKLGTGLMSGRYSSKPEGPGIAPVMFKNLIGKGHPDFATKKQQDAQEFFIHFITTVQRNSRHQMDPSECFKFEVEDRFECSSSNKVKYTSRTEYCLPLTIPLEAAVNIKEVTAFEARKAEGNKMDPNELVRPRIKLSSCLEMFSRVEVVEQFYSAAINGKTTARKTTRLASFPPYLFVHLKKFSLREDWVPVKLDVAVEMPDRIDLTGLRGRGQQEGEELLPELKGPLRPPSPHLDPVIMGQLIDMGFPPEAAKKAVFFTGNTDLESATNWMMQHIEDSDFGDTFVPPGLEAKHVAPSEEAVEMIMAMGFPRTQAVRALAATENNVMRAADWIFNHPDELDEPTAVEMAVDTDQPVKTSIDDGSGQYRLVAFISHMGTSTMVGHYVCHILRDNQWVIYNDEKVALSENPPTDLGYLYLYQRI